MIYNCRKINNLNDLKLRKDQVAIFNRKSPKGFDIFFENLYVSPYSVRGIVNKNTAKTGENIIVKNTTHIKLAHACQIKVSKGDTIILKTPGGAGYE